MRKTLDIEDIIPNQSIKSYFSCRASVKRTQNEKENAPLTDEPLQEEGRNEDEDENIEICKPKKKGEKRQFKEYCMI